MRDSIMSFPLLYVIPAEAGIHRFSDRAVGATSLLCTLFFENEYMQNAPPQSGARRRILLETTRVLKPHDAVQMEKICEKRVA